MDVYKIEKLNSLSINKFELLINIMKYWKIWKKIMGENDNPNFVKEIQRLISEAR